MLKNAEVIVMFLEGETKGKASNLRIEGDKLINYNTVLAQRGDTMMVNLTGYSSSTSKIQNRLLAEIDYTEIEYDIALNIPIGCQNLFE
jgi:hypothetical protein